MHIFYMYGLVNNCIYNLEYFLKYIRTHEVTKWTPTTEVNPGKVFSVNRGANPPLSI